LGEVSSKSVWKNIDSFPASTRNILWCIWSPVWQCCTGCCDCIWKHFWYSSCATHCRKNQQVCSAGNIKKYHNFHISL
jgi:hypothetical protein